MNKEKCKCNTGEIMGAMGGCGICSPVTLPDTGQNGYNKAKNDFEDGLWEEWSKSGANEFLEDTYDFWIAKIKSLLSSTEKRVAQTILKEIKESPKTFGLLDKQGNGGAILVMDIEEIIKSKYE